MRHTAIGVDRPIAIASRISRTFFCLSIKKDRVILKQIAICVS